MSLDLKINTPTWVIIEGDGCLAEGGENDLITFTSKEDAEKYHSEGYVNECNARRVAQITVVEDAHKLIPMPEITIEKVDGKYFVMLNGKCILTNEDRNTAHYYAGELKDALMKGKR